MRVLLNEAFEEVMEPFSTESVNFFLAASLYHARKVSFSAAAALAELSFDAFLHRLQEHFGTGFRIEDETAQEDITTVDKILEHG